MTDLQKIRNMCASHRCYADEYANGVRIEECPMLHCCPTESGDPCNWDIEAMEKALENYTPKEST